MSIINSDADEEVVHLPGFWTLVFKLALAASIPITMSIVGLMVWSINQIFDHEGRLDLVEFQLTHSRAASAGNPNTNIITSDAAHMAQDKEKSARGYLTTAEVAAREGKTERTITEWIASGMIDPAPVKSGKEWQIAANYRIPPKDADNCGDAEEGKP